MKKEIDFKKAYYTATKYELYWMAQEAFRLRGVAADRLDEAVYIASQKMKQIERDKKLKPQTNG